MKTLVQSFVDRELGFPGQEPDPYNEETEHAARILQLLERLPELYEPRSGGRNCPFCGGLAESNAHKAYCKRDELRVLMRKMPVTRSTP